MCFCYFSIKLLLQCLRPCLQRGRFSINSTKFLSRNLRRGLRWSMLLRESPASLFIFIFSRIVFCFNKAKVEGFLQRWSKVWTSRNSPSIFSRTVFCFNEAKAGDFLLRRSKVMTLVSDEHCVTWSYFFLFPDEPFLLQWSKSGEFFVATKQSHGFG
jgi:hypothetical protein